MTIHDYDASVWGPGPDPGSDSDAVTLRARLVGLGSAGRFTVALPSSASASVACQLEGTGKPQTVAMPGPEPAALELASELGRPGPGWCFKL